MSQHPTTPSAEITPYALYVNRRRFMALAGSLTAGALVLGGCGGEQTQPQTETAPPPTTASSLPPALAAATPVAKELADEIDAPLNSYEDIVGYTNFYEFTTTKEAVGTVAAGFNPTPWTVEVGGLVKQPLTLDLNDIYHDFAQEERIFRMRCVEGFSMVIPWVGFALRDLLALAQPEPAARFVKFTSILRPEEMPGQKSPLLTWPYTEGLRLDEAMHELTTLATGMYGQPLTRQQGAPVRLVVPWKYGFKSIKSVAKIELVDTMPTTTWMLASPREYGFYANVNPQVPHPRWSQATERRIGEVFRRKTLLFNGYGEQVAELYAGMDLTKEF